MNPPRLPSEVQLPHPTKRRSLWPIILGITLPIGLLAACTVFSNDTPPTDDPPPVESSVESATKAPEPSADPLSPPPSNATVEDLRAYYETLVAELNQALLDARTDRFLSDHASEQKIAELREALAAALERLDQAEKGETDTTPRETVTQPTATETAPTEKEDGQALPYTYQITDGSITITAYTGKGGDVSIPASINGSPVVAIGEGAFQGTSVTSVTLPDTVTHLGWFAFYGCQSLTSIRIPASVTRMDYAALDACPKLVIYCAPDSYAARYAAGFGLTHLPL